MDIVRTNLNQSRTRRYWLIAAAVALLIAIAAVAKTLGRGSYIVDADTLLFGTVQRGDFSVLVRGHGVLVPKDVHWVTAEVEGNVDRVFVKAGAAVRTGDPILELSNPKLLKELEKNRWELEAVLAENRAREVELESQLMALKDEVLNTRLAHDSAKLRLDAQTELLKRGNTTVSKLDYQESKLTVAQYQERLAIQQDRLDKMREHLIAQRESHAARSNMMRNTLNEAQAEVEALTVTARSDGVIQEMPLQLGQQVRLGGHIAKIARHHDLIAELQIQEIQIRDVAVGQPVTIDTRTSVIDGVVARIDPAVTDGTVVVDVELSGDLPAEARPDLSVEGTIRIAEMKDTLFVDRPVFAQSFSDASVFRLIDNDSAAERIVVRLGQGSTRYVEVVSGLEAGDRIIVSDPSAWESHQRILIN